MSATRCGDGMAERVRVDTAGVLLEGDLELPANPRGVVLCPHGRGTERGPYDAFVAAQLRQAGLGTWLLDLLTPAEANLDARKAAFRFDISLLAGRLGSATDWLTQQPGTQGLPVGAFASGPVAAAALIAAVARPGVIGALVAHDGRLDLAEGTLARLATPTLLIVGGNDPTLLGINRTALAQLGSDDKQLVLVPDATGITELSAAAGPLAEVARLAQEWFIRFMPGRA